jgi:hypothetical protein
MTHISQLQACNDAAALHEFLRGRRDLVSGTIVTDLTDEARRRLRIDVDDALHLADIALEIATILADASALGQGFRAKANALWFKGDCRAAGDLFDKAVAQFEQAGLAGEIGRTLSSSIQALSLLGEYDRALRSAARGRSSPRWTTPCASPASRSTSPTSSTGRTVSPMRLPATRALTAALLNTRMPKESASRSTTWLSA